MADVTPLPRGSGFDRARRMALAGAHGALTMAQMNVVRTSAEFALTGSGVDRSMSLEAIVRARTALEEIEALLKCDPPPTAQDVVRSMLWASTNPEPPEAA